VQGTAQFLPGDRVRVDSNYWNADVAGRTGTVAEYPDGATPQQGAVWVDFDVIKGKAGVVDGAEVDVGSLRRAFSLARMHYIRNWPEGLFILLMLVCPLAVVSLWGDQLGFAVALVVALATALLLWISIVFVACRGSDRGRRKVGA
jgi:hypothetical protein